MKNLKSIYALSIFFSSLFVIAVFFNSCNQSEDISPIEEMEKIEKEDLVEIDAVPVAEDAIIFTLPQEYFSMPEAELRDFFENLSEEEFLKIAVIVPADQAEGRLCTAWKYKGTRCRNHINCHDKGEFNKHTRWCPWPQAAYSFLNRCCP